MKHMFNVYVRGILDYGAVIWYPQNYTKIDQLEQVVRIYTKKIPAVSYLTYCKNNLGNVFKMAVLHLVSNAINT